MLEVFFQMWCLRLSPADYVDMHVSIDSVEVSPLAVASGGGGGLSADTAEVASSADTAGVACSADLARMVFLAIAGVVSPADLPGMAFPAVAGVASPADLAGMAFPVIDGAAHLAVVEVASSTDSMVVAGSPSVCSSQCAYDCLVPDDYVTESDVVFPGSNGRN